MAGQAPTCSSRKTLQQSFLSSSLIAGTANSGSRLILSASRAGYGACCVIQFNCFIYSETQRTSPLTCAYVLEPAQLAFRMLSRRSVARPPTNVHSKNYFGLHGFLQPGEQHLRHGFKRGGKFPRKPVTKCDSVFPMCFCRVRRACLWPHRSKRC
jgi:hypothetical protein